jgi:hypothetical protein
LFFVDLMVLYDVVIERRPGHGIIDVTHGVPVPAIIEVSVPPIAILWLMLAGWRRARWRKELRPGQLTIVVAVLLLLGILAGLHIIDGRSH